MKHTRPEYHAYIVSKAWKRQAHAARVRAGFKCQLCGAADRVLDVHHNTYARLGHEPAADLVVLCRECHDAHHLRQRNPRLWKAFVAMARLF